MNLSIALTGKTVSNETRLKLRLANLGKKQSEETIRKRSASMLGRIVSEHTRELIRQKHLGKKKIYTPESYKRLCESRKGRKSWNKGLTGIYSEATIEKMRQSRMGNKAPTWKGGVTPIHSAIRRMLESRLWRESVKNKCGKVCFYCGGVEKLKVHHIKPFHEILTDFLKLHNDYSPIEDRVTLSIFARDYKPFWDVNNGMVLCVKCHQKVHSKGRK